MRYRVAIIVIVLGVLTVLTLSSLNQVFAIGNIGDCDSRPTWGCLKCVYHPTCDPRPPVIDDNKNSG